ncbi:MAG: hypothetical protein DMD60_09025 [Gemmatimonadetes bacterium]|nr:MAG: hypothetical protein DMD60_09025 [Gemmatimonadota bacterium]
MVSTALPFRLGLIALGLSYVVSLVFKRLRGERNPDPKLARLESLQLLGFAGGLASGSLLWLSVQLRAPLPVDYLFIGAFLAGMLLWVGAYIGAWRP